MNCLRGADPFDSTARTSVPQAEHCGELILSRDLGLPGEALEDGGAALLKLADGAGKRVHLAEVVE